MPPDARATRPARHWRTTLVASTRRPSQNFPSLAPSTHRGSTVVFARLGEAVDDWQQADRYTYGLYGTPTTLELGLRLAELEGAHHTFIVPGGQAALALVYLAYCTAGSHALVPANAYGPNLEIARDLLRGLDVEVETYDPMAGAGIAAALRANTALVWCESPGSITMEVQDVPAIVRAAHARGVAVALDNTYAAGVLFDAFGHGVDVSVQAITKFVGGHSDILLGSISVADAVAYGRVGTAHRVLGMNASPDDCALALRGLQTLGVRLDRLEKSTLEIAAWLRARPEVATVLHPAFPDCPGHALWQRDFTGSSSVFSIVLADGWTLERTTRFVDGLRLFKLGFSWGGVTSLAMAYPDSARLGPGLRERLVRLNVGLEEPADLVDDLRQALDGC